jgi:hypothetical protein
MGGHEVGGRLVVVRSWSRWEGVEGLQNVSAVGRRRGRQL